jgi:hypothetical protein
LDVVPKYIVIYHMKRRGERVIQAMRMSASCKSKELKIPEVTRNADNDQNTIERQEADAYAIDFSKYYYLIATDMSELPLGRVKPLFAAATAVYREMGQRARRLSPKCFSAALRIQDMDWGYAWLIISLLQFDLKI